MIDANPRLMLITGAAGEIGADLARHYLSAGWRVVGIDRRVAGAAPAGMVPVVCDLADGAATHEAIATIVHSHGAPDVLVNGAGRIANAPVVTRSEQGWTPHDFALWRDVVDSSLTSAFHASAVTVTHMLAARRPGLIINVSSVCASGNPGQAAYSAAKAGLDGLTRTLAKELGPLGIRVVGLAPGYFDTRSMHENVAASRLGKVTGSVPLRRLGALAEIASAVDFIIGNGYLNGTVLHLDGGLVL